MSKKNPIKLPPLPDSEPEGDMADYLAFALATQADKSAKTATSRPETMPNTESLTGLNSGAEVVSRSFDAAHTKAEFICLPQPEAHSSRQPTAPVDSTNGGNQGVDLSKILDKSDVIDGNDGEKQKLTKPASEKPVLSPGRHRLTRSGASTELTLEQYLQSIPEVFTSSVYGKGEVKLRVTEQMGYLLQLISNRDEDEPRPKFVAENLLNELLREFFVRYGSAIAHLSAEAQRREADRQERRLMGIKHILSGA